MRRTLLKRWMAAGLLVLGACGGGRDAGDAPTATRLDLPAAAQARDAECERPDSAAGLLRHRQVGARCLRSFGGFDPQLQPVASRQRILAVAVPPTAAELFDWAEATYPQYFPSRQSNRTLGPYTYRYYAQTQNHVAVAGDLVYVQGPLSDGALLYIDTVAAFTCLVHPTRCTPLPDPKPCAAIAQWTVGANTCTPNADQTGAVASGITVAYLDSAGSTRGNVNFTCTDGVMAQKGDAVCEPAPQLACNTAGLTWTVGSNSCTANASEPTQLVSGGIHTFRSSSVLVGNATYRCFDGTLTATAAPTCAAPTNVFCRPQNLTWTASGHLCAAETAPEQVPVGGSFSVTDFSGGVTGTASFTCTAGGLSAPIDPVCVPIPHMQDSFGGDGGAADGGASGDGTAGDGAPIVGGLVKVVDRLGNQATATTNGIGYYRVKLTGFSPPFVISVTRPDGVVRRSISTQALKTNGYIFMAVTGLTDRIASDVAKAAGFPGAASLTPAMVQQNPSAVTAAINAIRNNSLVRPLLVEAGIDPDTFNPLSAPFRADGTGYDQVLDNLIITTDATGATVIASVNCTAPRTWTVANVTCTSDEGEETVVLDNRQVTHRDTVGPTTGSVRWTCQKGKIQAPVLPSCTVGGGSASSPTR